MDPIQRLREFGQSVWLDFLDHELLASGELDRLIRQHGLAGLTSNPTILQKAIASSDDYDDLLKRAPKTKSNPELFEDLAVAEVTRACDAFAALHQRTEGADGFASIEVSPELARDTDGSIEAAQRLWRRVARPNVMVKIPGTREGLPAIEECVAAGVNVNITLLFSVERYLDVAERYLHALERRIDEGKAVHGVASVASFFVSRVDAKVDPALDAVIAAGGPAADRARAVRGRAAIANAKTAFDEYERLFQGTRWNRLAQRGARPQRVLWASTTPKDPAYPPLHYAEALVGHGTIDTMTPETLRKYLASGAPEARLEAPRHSAAQDLEDLAALGVDLTQIEEQLETAGIDAFAASYRSALEAIAEKRAGR